MNINFNGKKILVAGGAGFIGSHTVDALIASGAEVVVVDNLSSGKKENINSSAKFYKANIADPEIEKILDEEKPNIICNFAFFVFVPQSVEDPLKDMDAICGTLRMLKKTRKINIEKFFFVTSGFLYGNNPNLPLNEDASIEPVSPYVVAKHAIENYIKFFNMSFGIPYVILRYAAVYGPRQVTGAMADYIRKLAKDEQAEIWGDGSKTRDYVFIEDVVRANLLALKISNGHPNPIFNIGTGKETTLNTLYKMIANILGKTPDPLYHPDRVGEQMRYALDNTKAKKEIGWEPRISLYEGLELTLQYARSNNFNI